jgi:prepilin-type N-terminal cleavage/methylation domain-containing protein
MDIIKNIFKRGFSLIEILIAISVIIIVFLISIIALKSFQPVLQLSGATRNLINDIRYAQQITITEQIKYCVKLFSTEKKYQVIKCESEEIVFEKTLPSEIANFTNSGFADNKIEYNPYGAVKESGTITLENNQGKTKIIEIKPSGFVTVINE